MDDIYRGERLRFPKDVNQLDLKKVLDNLVRQNVLDPALLNQELAELRKRKNSEIGQISKNPTLFPTFIRWHLKVKNCLNGESPDIVNNITPEELEEVLEILVGKQILRPSVINVELDQLREEQKEKVLRTIEKTGDFELSPEQRRELFSKLKERFKNNQRRHKFIFWHNVEAKLNQVPSKKLWSLWKMEETGGEPDVIDYDSKTGEYIFFDCSLNSPIGRRNLVYDKRAEDWIKANRSDKRCKGNAVDIAIEMGIEILDERQYRYLQKLGNFDQENTWSWLRTPDYKRGCNVVFCGWRNISKAKLEIFEFTPHNYDSLGGFRGSLRV